MEVIIFTIVVIALLVFAFIWALGGAKRKAKKLVGQTEKRACAITVGSNRWLMLFVVLGEDTVRLEPALKRHVLAGDLLGDLIASRLKGLPALDDALAGPELAKALQTNLTETFRNDGLALKQTTALGSISLDDPQMLALKRYVATECYHKNRSTQINRSVMDIYLDGSTGRADYSVECAPKAGGIVQHLTSKEILQKRDYIMEVSIDGKSIVANRSLNQMLKGK